MHSLDIYNFKNFKHLKIDNLGKVNLIVGKNNAGKSTLLEAISVVASGANINWLMSLLETRGINPRYSPSIEQPELYELENLSTLYHNRNHKEFKENPLKVISQINGEEVTVEIKLVELVNVIEIDEEGNNYTRKKIKDTLNEMEIIEGEESLGLLISYKGNRSIYSIGSVMRRAFPSEKNIPFEYVKTSEFTGEKNPILFDKVALSPLEPYLINALRIIDPEIKAINFLNDEGRSRYVQTRNTDNRIPFVVLNNSSQKYRLSTMGDGINRILTIILSMLNCKDGILLVDEFENGLHYTVQTSLWSLICKLARELNVQVFATTHSQDCIKSFLSATNTAECDSRLIRLEKRENKEIAVIYDDEEDLQFIVSHNIETR